MGYRVDRRTRDIANSVDTYFIHTRFYIGRRLQFWWKMESTGLITQEEIVAMDKEAIERYGE